MVLPEDESSIPSSHVRWFTTAWNSSSEAVQHLLSPEAHTHTIKNNSFSVLMRDTGSIADPILTMLA